MLEIDVGGVYVPAPLVWALGAFALSLVIDRGLSRTGFYALLWHRALFEVAVFGILWGAASAAAYYMAFSNTGLRH